MPSQQSYFDRLVQLSKA
uniref:Uncharacterized protein n=1 Tax=Rhizophora mucronata TaxID=61149 RepID=A0A2P2QNI8_RHIMU